MGFIVRLVIGLAGGLVALAMLLVFLTFLVSEPATSRAPASTRAERDAAARVRGSAARDDFERVERGVIVPVRAADELLNQCSRETVSPIEGFWRPTPSMVAELEARLPTFLSYESRLQPLDRYARQYVGVVSMGQPLVYASFVIDPLGEWERQVVVLCDGGNLAWGVAFDVDRKTFGEVGINGDFGGRW
jgi:hypothetical protein